MCVCVKCYIEAARRRPKPFRYYHCGSLCNIIPSSLAGHIGPGWVVKYIIRVRTPRGYVYVILCDNAL